MATAAYEMLQWPTQTSLPKGVQQDHDRLTIKASYQVLLAGLHLQSVHTVLVGRRQLNIYSFHAQNGHRNIVILLTVLTHNYFRCTSALLVLCIALLLFYVLNVFTVT